MASQWCEKHWRVIFTNPRINSIVACSLLIQKLIENKEFMGRCGYVEPISPADVDRMNVEIIKVSPICCWLGDEIMLEIYEEAYLPSATIH